jgi:hypothetical protein
MYLSGIDDSGKFLICLTVWKRQENNEHNNFKFYIFFFLLKIMIRYPLWYLCFFNLNYGVSNDKI